MPLYLGTCKNVNILMISNASAGIQAVLTSTETEGEQAGVDSSPVNLTITGHYLPPECRVNHVCDILHFSHHDGTSHYIIPAIRGFVVLYHWAVRKDDHTEELPWNSFTGVTEDCNPTRAFLARNNRILIVACMNLQSQPYKIHYTYYSLLSNSTGSGWIIRRHTILRTKSKEILNPATVSEIIHVRGQKRCQERDNLYFIAGEMIQFPTSGTSDPGFSFSDPLGDCIGYQSLEHYHGSDNIIVRCSNNRTALYDSCGTNRFTYAPDDGIPYPCTNWSTVAYCNGTQLTLDGETQLLPSGDINYAKCVHIHGVDRPVFVVSSTDGIFISRFDGNNFTKITNGSCSTDSDSGACPRPVFSENNDVFGTCDSERLVIANTTKGCTDNPIIAQLPALFQPALVSISLGRGVYNCSCSAIGPGPLTTESALNVSQTEQTERAGQPYSTMATHQTYGESTFLSMNSSPSPSHRAPISHIKDPLVAVLIPVTVLMTVLVTVVAFIVIAIM